MNIKPKSTSRYDMVSLGEIMLRLDPGDMRVRTARQFQVWEGGGEYNVARGLKRCFGMNTGVVTALVDNEVGRLVEDLIFQGGVDMSYVKWIESDGVGRKARNGLNFTERGFGLRAAKGCSDRGHTAVSQLKPGDIDWKKLFFDDGVRWFHCGGIFAGLSDSTGEVVKEAMTVAREAGTIISYDLNYRASLWQDNGGRARAQEVNRQLAGYVDVMIGNEEDFSAALGYDVEGLDLDVQHEKFDTAKFKAMIKKVVADYPGFKAIATTLRNAKTATINDWGAILYCGGEFFEALELPDLEIFDRVGGGDSFASGLVYGFMTGKAPGECVNYGAAHGALAMTTPGDTTMATLDDVERVVRGGSARVSR